MSSILNLGVSLGGLSAAPDGNTYAANERAGWARDDFASLFEQRLQMSEARAGAADNQTVMGDGSSNDDPGAADAEIEFAAATGLNTSTGDFSPAISASDVIGLEQPAVDFDGTGVWTTSVSDPSSGNGSQSEDLSAAEAPASDSLCKLSEAQAMLPDTSVTVHIDDGVVAACIRNAGMDGTDAGQLVATLRSQLAVQGLSLGSLRLNGESLWQPGGGAALVQNTMEPGMNDAVTNTMEMNNVG